MLSLGIDIGTSTVKLVLLKDKEIEKQWMAVHHGNPFVCLKRVFPRWNWRWILRFHSV